MNPTLAAALVTFSVLALTSCGPPPSQSASAPANHASEGTAIMWPELPKTGFVSGRAATTADVAAGDAIFVLKDGAAPIGRPLEIPIPQYAYHIEEESGHRTPGIVVQAEQAGDSRVVGMRKFDGTELVGFFHEFQLLGSDKPGR